MHHLFYANAILNARKNVLRGDFMGRFKIPVIPSSTNKSIRFPNDLIDAVENAIRGKDCTFSAFVIAPVRAALEDLAEEERE
jgi:hypothetical protein